MVRKLIGISAAFALVLSLVGVSAVQAAALTQSQISAIVSLLQSFGADSATVANVTASLNGQPTSGSMTSAPVVSAGLLTKTLSTKTAGTEVAEVTSLQQILIAGGYLKAGYPFGFFGGVTKTAVMAFQSAKGLTADGIVGAKSRAILNSMSGSVSTTGGTVITGTTSGTDVLVSLAATSPMASALIAGQAAANLAEFTFTNRSAAPAVVTNVSLNRIGVSGDTSLTNVYLYNGAVRLTDAASVSAGKITFNAASGIFTVPAGSSMTVSVKADIASDANGQLVGVALTGVSSSLQVSAVYPVSGASMSVFSSSDIAAATSTLTAGVIAGGSITAGSLNQTIWSTSLSLSGRAVYLKSLALKVIGSIPSNSLQNVKLYVAGIQVATAMGMDANGMVTFDLTSMPYKIDSSRTLEVRADVVNGSSRTFSVQLQNASDLMIIDSNYNVGISVATPATQSSGTYTVSTGSVTVQLDPSLAAGNVVTGASNVALARYTMKAYGEDMKISYLQASSSDQLDNVSLYANGIQIGSTKTISTVGVATLFSLGSSLIIPAGQTVTVEIRGDIKYNGVNATTTSNTVTVNLSGYTNNAQGSYSSQLSTVPAAAGINGPAMTVVGAGLTVAKNASVSDSSQVPNTSGVMIGSYVLQANSSEAIRVTNLTVALGGTVVATTSLSNLYVSIDGVSATPVSPQSSNNFSVDFTIPSNASKIVNVYADVSNTTGTATTSLTLNGYGTGSNITVSSAAVYGQVVTVGAGSLAVPTVANTSPDAQLVVGSTVSKIVDFNFVSTNGASVISEMYFDVTGPIVSLTVGGVTYPVISGSSTANGLSISVPVGYGGLNVPVVATYATIGLNGEVSLQTANVKVTGFKYTSGNSTVSTTTLSVTSNTMTVVASKPTVTLSQGDTAVLAGGTKILARVTVAADSKGDVKLITLPLNFVTSANASATGLQVKVGSTVASSTFASSTLYASGNVSNDLVSFLSGNGYTVPAGTSVTFDVYGSVSLTADPSSILTSVGSASSFVWQDVNGNATTTGAYIYNFPTNSSSMSY